MCAILISASIGYLLGSIPFGYVLVRVFRGADVRTTGSGNIGATNVARTSPALGVVTLIAAIFHEQCLPLLDVARRGLSSLGERHQTDRHHLSHHACDLTAVDKRHRPAQARHA